MSAPASSKFVVVVDDNRALTEVLVQYLAAIGVGAESVEPDNVEQVAITVIARNPDVVLLDLDLGCFHGTDVARRIRTMGFTGVVVAMTGGDVRDLAGDGELADFDTYWGKPVDPDTIKTFLLGSGTPRN